MTSMSRVCDVYICSAARITLVYERVPRNVSVLKILVCMQIVPATLAALYITTQTDHIVSHEFATHPAHLYVKK
jgi:hypothetical protein